MKPALLPDLATFVTIVEHGNFSTAARITGATPSAISRCVSRLEQEMGSKLLHRTTRKLALTETGKSVYEHALDMLEAAQQAMDSGSSVQTVAQGKLTVSVPKAVGRFVIHPLIPEFLERYPQIDVCLRLEDRYMDLIDDGVDLALRITSTPSPGLYGKPLMPVTHVICATPEYLRRAGTPQHPHDLRAHSCISLGETPADSRWKFTGENGDRTDARPLCCKPHGRAAGCGKTSCWYRELTAVYSARGFGKRGDCAGSAGVGIYQQLYGRALVALDAQQTYASQNAGDDQLPE